MDKQIIVYEPNEQTKMEVKTDGETVWLTQDQMCQLFGRDQSVIARHIKNIFKEGELEKEVVYAKFAYTTRHGAITGKTQTHDVGYYNLDILQYVLNGDCRSNVGVFGLGKESTSCLASLIRGKTVRVEWVKKDQYGRVLGIVFLPNAAAAPAKS